jgi:hypothetical protein
VSLFCLFRSRQKRSQVSVKKYMFISSSISAAHLYSRSHSPAVKVELVNQIIIILIRFTTAWNECLDVGGQFEIKLEFMEGRVLNVRKKALRHTYI